MKENKEIESRDINGDWHGYNEWYHENKLWIRSLYKHRNPMGYHENHYVKHTRFYIN